MQKRNSGTPSNRRNVLKSLGLLGTGIGSSAFVNGTVSATQTSQTLDPVVTPSSNDRIEKIWDEIVDLAVDFVSGPIPLGSKQPQLNEQERQKTIKALKSLAIEDGDQGDEGGEYSNPLASNADREIQANPQATSVPSTLPFDLCYSLGYSKVCVDSNRPQVGSPRCYSYVPEMLYFSFSVNQLSRNLTGDWEVDFSAENLWLGVDSSGCVWAGEETSGTCAKLDCPNTTVRYHTDPASEVAKSALGHALEAARDAYDDFNEKFSGWQYYVAAAIIALALVIAAIKFFPATFFVGGTVIIASKSVAA